MDIVRTVGISAGTFYKYFPDKRELFRPFTIRNSTERAATIRATHTALFDYADQNPEIMPCSSRVATGSMRPSTLPHGTGSTAWRTIWPPMSGVINTPVSWPGPIRGLPMPDRQPAPARLSAGPEGIICANDPACAGYQIKTGCP